MLRFASILLSRTPNLSSATVFSVLLLLQACTDDPVAVTSAVDAGADSGSPNTGADGGVDAGNISPGADATVGPTPGECRDLGPNGDDDGDGFTPADGDCNDCSPQINPGAYDFPGNAFDEDCSGSAASAADLGCETGLKLDSTSAEDAARALGLCTFTDAASRGWGVVSARFTTADGSGKLDSPLQVGLLPNFGSVQTRSGAAMLALSSGVARAPNQAGYGDDCGQFSKECNCGVFDLTCLASCGGGAAPPAGYPKDSSSCSAGVFAGVAQVYNQAALELHVRVPTNAKSLAFDSNFYTHEYPNFVCSAFNDFYVAFKQPRSAGVSDDNLVFDRNNDPIGVNTGLLSVCNPQTIGQKRFDCDQGQSLLAATGFDVPFAGCNNAGGSDAPGAATGWLHTTSPAEAGQIITLRFAIWDTGDSALDSTVLIDNFEWSVDEPKVETTPILLR